MKILATKRVMAAFVLAFLCLNAAGTLCLSYCSGLSALTASAEIQPDDSHLSEHCRAMKAAAIEQDRDREKAYSIEPACCMMPVAMLAVPIERTVKIDTADAPAAMPASFEYTFEAAATSHSISIQQPVYRPPPLDRRIERQLNCVIRI